jgi:phenylacetate-CoA ligase
MSKSAYFDKREIRSPELREKKLFGDLRRQLKAAKAKSSAWRHRLKGVAHKDVKSRADLAELPVLRKSDLLALQAEDPPFAGLVPSRYGKISRVFMSPGPIFEPEGRAKDWWGAARAFYAAGGRRGDLVHNAFAYHLTPAGHMFESGAFALGCAVFPAGTGNTEAQVDAIARLKPRGYTGTPDFLHVLLERAAELKQDVSSLKYGLVGGAALPPSLRADLTAKGVDVVQCYGTAELGIISYESDALEGMIVNEDYIVEIVRPGTGTPVADGEVGEVVVTRLNEDYPLLRLATGDLSAVMTGTSPCGRTNMRIAGWMGRADQTAKVKGMFVRPEQVAAVLENAADVDRLRFVITRKGQSDLLTVRAEAARQSDDTARALAVQVLDICKLKAQVELVAPGALPNDGVVIADERDYN